MKLTPEERLKIYEEEKARIEAEKFAKSYRLPYVPQEHVKIMNLTPEERLRIFEEEKARIETEKIAQNYCFQYVSQGHVKTENIFRRHTVNLFVKFVLIMIPILILFFFIIKTVNDYNNITKLKAQMIELQGNPTDEVYLENAKSLLNIVTTYPNLRNDALNFQTEYEERSANYLQQQYDLWIDNWSNQDLSVKYVRERIKEILKFEPDKDFSDSELLKMDFRKLQLDFGNAIMPITEQLESKYSDLDKIDNSSRIYHISDELRNLINESKRDIRKSQIVISETGQKITRCALAGENVKNKARYTQLQKRFKKNYEEGIHTTWYKQVSIPKYINSRSWAIWPYIGKKDNADPWLCLTVGYTRSDWIFIGTGGSIAFVIDGSDYKMPYDGYLDVDDYITGGNVSEWVDKCDEDSIIRAIAKAKRTVVSITGSNGNRRIEHVLSATEMNAFKETVEFYDLLRDQYN